MLIRLTCTTEFLNTYGWRIPFFCGACMGCVGVYLRQRLMPEGLECDQAIPGKALVTTVAESSSSSSSSSSALLSTHSEGETSLKPPQWGPSVVAESSLAVVGRYSRLIVELVLVASLWGCAYYSIFTWMVYYLTSPDLIGECALLSGETDSTTAPDVLVCVCHRR